MARRRTSQALSVYLNAEQVGRLERRPSGAISFQYDPTWLNREDAIPISNSLPLQEAAYRGQIPLAYFENLLPDDMEVRRYVAQEIGAKSYSTYDLLSATGKDCVGALQFLPEKVPPPLLASPSGKKASTKQIADRLNGLSKKPLGLRKQEEFRISIAGAQKKTAYLRKGNEWFQPTGATPTTHIFKPSIGKFPDGLDLSTSVENEWLCLKIAKILGLEVAEAEMKTFHGVKCLVVKRFDRKWDVDKNILFRVPQEDLCQAFGVSTAQKYEEDGGPGIQAIMEFLNSSDERDLDREKFLRAQLVFFLLGASDGHAKNFSIFLTSSGFRLTPIYDILSVFPMTEKRQMEIQKIRFAMAVGKGRRYKLREIVFRHWKETARLCQFDLDPMEDIVQDLRARISDDLEKKLRVPASFPRPVLNPILKGLRKQLSFLT